VPGLRVVVEAIGRGIGALALAIGVAAQCADTISRAAPAASWEPVDAPILPAPLDAAEASVSLATVSPTPGLQRRWQSAPASLRDGVMARGFACARAVNPGVRLGDFYAALQDQGVPSVVTVDTLFFLTHIALDRAFADIDGTVIEPLVGAMLQGVGARLRSDGHGAAADLAPAYRVARAVVAVARALEEPSYGPEPDIAQWVGSEQQLVLSHARITMSPALGVPVDYSAMAPRGMADSDDAHAARFRAVAWLQNAWLALGGTEQGESRERVDVATTRVHARAALLLARAVDGRVDPVAANAWERIERASALMVGDAADVTPHELCVAAERADLDVRDLGWLANIVRVDRVRHDASLGRTGATFRLLGPRATPDGELLQSLTFPVVGPRSSPDGFMADPTARLFRAGARTLPTALDVAAWLGSGEARAAVHDAGGDEYPRYEETIDRLARARASEAPESAFRHRTPYLSMIDAIETWIRPSAGDRVQPGSSTVAWRKRKAAVGLAAWTELRHDATALTRIALTAATPAPRPTASVTVPVFVEPHPEAIGKLVGVVRQTGRLIATEGTVPAGSPALRVLREVEDLLWTALGAAMYETANERLPSEIEKALVAFPERIRALEGAMADSGAADVPLVVDVHVDIRSARVLEEATGRIEEAWMAVREPGSGRLWLALGASIPHDELVEAASARLSDKAWRARMQTEGDPPPSALARAFAAGP
jgi:hypothetical protein